MEWSLYARTSGEEGPNLSTTAGEHNAYISSFSSSTYRHTKVRPGLSRGSPEQCVGFCIDDAINSVVFPLTGFLKGIAVANMDFFSSRSSIFGANVDEVYSYHSIFVHAPFSAKSKAKQNKNK